MMIIGYISGGIAVLIMLCLMAHELGYRAGYKQAVKDIRKHHREKLAHL